MKKYLLFGLIGLFVIGVSAYAKDYIIGYDANNNPVQVESGVYVPGISLFPHEVALGGVPRVVTVIDDSTASTTSSAIPISGAKKVTLFLSTDIPTATLATSTFAVTVSGDDSNYTTFNKLVDNVANTISQNLTRVASKTYDATTTAAIVSLDLDYDSFTSFKVGLTQTYGAGGSLGGATVDALIEY